MVPFLKQVAKVYFENEREEMIDYCFVFPNKRSGVFFRHFLEEEAKGMTFIFPEISTIAEMVSSFSSLVEAPRLEQLFILYNEYKALSKDIADFDQFLFWGDMLLSDFNDVDRYLVDPHLLFVNLKRFKEVSANYLTDEQRELIARYWGDQFVHQSPDKFWNHLHHEESTELEAKFLKLWEVLDPLFNNFKKKLMDNGMATAGMLSRNAVDYLKLARTSVLPYRRYIFVGFNVLTLSEIKIFERLQARGCGDYYWDIASPAFKAKGNRAARFMRNNVKCFPSKYDINSEYTIPENYFPEIYITGVPSGIGQAKAAGQQLEQWVKDGEIPNPENAIDTAVVLPDESLFIPMIHSVPPSITALNVTMGYPMKTTSFASFIAAIVSLHLRGRKSRDVWKYFYEDVKFVISHPFLQSIDKEGCERMLRLISEKRLYMIPANVLMEQMPDVAFIFTPITNSNGVEEVYAYFRTLINSFSARIGRDDTYGVERFFLQAYGAALEELIEACRKWGIEMKDSTFIELLQRTISSVSINFTGQPLKGLQLMGVLETRVLDFDNLIMLSMNERVFPRKHYTRSFIPDSLRKSYGMATTDFQESIYAYYFYRLISRAKKVRLFYDARTVGTRNSEVSRYISQLIYLFPECKITHDVASYPMEIAEDEIISIQKTEEIMNRLRQYTIEGGPNLSASSINTYINCPLQFYLQNVCGLNVEDEIVDYMDSSTYGTILHEAAEIVYKELRGTHSEVRITKEILDSITADKSKWKLEQLITRLINKHYNHFSKEELLTPLVGESKVLGHVMLHFLRKMFNEEKKIAPFDFIDGEHEIKDRMWISDDITINFRQYIDRIDRIYPPDYHSTGLLRIVDYKTGEDKSSFSGMDDLFNPEKDDRAKAILQLMFYCNAYAAKQGVNAPIQPQLYLFKTISNQGLNPLKYGKEPFMDYREVNEEFMERFRGVIKEIFDPEVPFTQAKSDHWCKFCTFKDICRKYTDDRR